MEKLLDVEPISSVAMERGEKLRSAASSNTMWAGILAVLLVIAGLVGGVEAGAASVGSSVDSTGIAVFGAIVGGFVGLTAGMVLYTQRRLSSQLALRLDAFFREREGRI